MYIRNLTQRDMALLNLDKLEYEERELNYIKNTLTQDNIANVDYRLVDVGITDIFQSILDEKLSEVC